MDYDFCDYFYDYAGISLITNFDKKLRKTYESALEKYNKMFPNRQDMYISDDAYDGWGNQLKDCNALLTTELSDKSQFWKIFDNIEKE